MLSPFIIHRLSVHRPSRVHSMMDHLARKFELTAEISRVPSQGCFELGLDTDVVSAPCNQTGVAAAREEDILIHFAFSTSLNSSNQRRPSIGQGSSEHGGL